MKEKYRREFNNPSINNGHMLPTIDIEQYVLGAQIVDEDAVVLISGILIPDFYLAPHHQKIQEAIFQLNEEGKCVDLLSVTARLDRMGHLNDVGGIKYISELFSKKAMSTNIVYYANIIVNRYFARIMLDFCSKFATRAISDDEDPASLLDDAVHELSIIDAYVHHYLKCREENFIIPSKCNVMN